METFSFRAECEMDIERFRIAAGKAGVLLRFNVLLEHKAEFTANVSLGRLRLILYKDVEDSHVMRETLRRCHLAENDMTRDQAPLRVQHGKYV